MNQQLYSNLVQRWAEHLSGEQNVKFDKILELSKSNRRVRNLCGFFALTSEEAFQMFLLMSQKDSFFENLRFNLVKALVRLERKSNPEVSNFAKNLKSKYFANMKPLVDDEYDVSAEMEKLYVTMVNSYHLANKKHDGEFQNKVNDTLNKFDLSALK